MSILIKGFSKKDFDELVQYARYGANNCMIGENTEVIEIPPHGRLIDADAFTKDECNNCDGACEALPCDCLNCKSDCRCDFMKDIADAPTIIPADGGE